MATSRMRCLTDLQVSFRQQCLGMAALMSARPKGGGAVRSTAPWGCSRSKPQPSVTLQQQGRAAKLSLTSGGVFCSMRCMGRRSGITAGAALTATPLLGPASRQVCLLTPWAGDLSLSMPRPAMAAQGPAAGSLLPHSWRCRGDLGLWCVAFFPQTLKACGACSPKHPPLQGLDLPSAVPLLCTGNT